MKSILVALGGNALLKKGQKGIAAQFRNIEKTTNKLASLAKRNVLTITHGNGPQVGNALIRVEEALGKAYSLPLQVIVAETEAEIGYILQQSLRNHLKKLGIQLPVISILTQVIVDKNDPSFKLPTKFVGPYYKLHEARKLTKKGMHIKRDPRGGYRRVVPSPRPKRIVEANSIKKFTKEAIVIAAGGGGIPVIEERGQLKGIEAVIDKDLASAVLAIDIKADLFLIITDVPCVYLNFKKKNQKALRKLTVKQAREYIEQQQFPAGSMLPKIKAAINFLEQRKQGKVIITSPEKLDKALKGREGTLIVR